MSRLARRVAALATSRPPTVALTPEIRGAVGCVAGQEGLDPEDLLAEVGALVREMAAAGAVTPAQHVAYLTARDGMSGSEPFAPLEVAGRRQQGHIG